MRLERTEHGFNFGAAEISATCSNDKKGWAILTVETPKERLQIYVTKTGKVRVWNSASKELDIQGVA